MPGGGFARSGSDGLGISEDRAVGVPKICLDVRLTHVWSGSPVRRRTQPRPDGES
jgi:hypothetical protein